MFSTILDKVTGSFDKRAIISTFFPSLVFWGLAVIVFIVFQVNWQVAVHTWDTYSGTIQFLLLLAFFVWVTFWSFLIINFRMAITRLFEGYWPEGRLLKGRREHWQNQWRNLSKRDDQLAEQDALLHAEQSSYKQLQTSLSSAAAQPAAVADANATGQELERFLNEVEPRVTPSGNGTPDSDSAPLSLKEIQQFGEQIRSWWTRFVPWLEIAQQDQQSPWSSRLKRLDTITRTLSGLVDQQLEEVEAKRVALYRDLSLYFPPSLTDIMPTRLGNVLKASELYSWKRYRIDAVVVWSRLQTSLPDAFSNPLQDAKSSFDLMITLCAFLLLFGTPISFWVAFKTTGFVPWEAALALAIVASLLRLYMPAVFAALAFIIALPFFHFPLWLMHLQVLAVLLAILALLFWLSYQNAVEAALDYAEKIKAAFDLYRWEVLKDLRLQFPKDFEEERKVWNEVGGLLLRGYTPNSRYYRYIEEKAPDKEVSYD